MSQGPYVAFELSADCITSFSEVQRIFKTQKLPLNVEITQLADFDGPQREISISGPPDGQQAKMLQIFRGVKKFRKNYP